MKKSISSTFIAGLTILMIAFAYNIDVTPLDGAGACNSPAGVKCPLGTKRTACKAGESVTGADGNCHCNAGLTRAGDGWCGGKPGEEVGGEENCEAVQSTYDKKNEEYTKAQADLAQAQADLTKYSNEYQAAVTANPSKVKAMGTFDSNTCIEKDHVSGCGADTGEVVTSESATSSSGTCTDITGQCNELDALLVSTNQSTCIIAGNAALFQTAVGTSTASSTATSTATTTTNTTVFTSVNVSPTIIRQGETFTLNATVASSSVQTYSISATKDGAALGNLLSNVNVGTTVRPTNISQSFKTAATIPTGTYILKIFNDANIAQFSTVNLVVNTASSVSTASSVFSSGTYTGSTSYNNGGSVIFLNPTANGSYRVGSTVLVHWGYNSNISGNMDLYVQTVCSNSGVTCTPSTTLVAQSQPVNNVYYNWTIPSYIQPNSWAVLIAKQGNNVAGYSPTFIVTQ